MAAEYEAKNTSLKKDGNTGANNRNPNVIRTIDSFMLHLGENRHNQYYIF